MPKKKLTEKEWKKILTKEQYNILRERGTEPPFSGKLLYNKDKGTYLCAACGTELFESKTKYESGTGWPSFYAPIEKNVGTKMDFSMIIPRVEVVCRNCGGHLGHLFNDGPKPTGKRFCINSAALEFKKGKKKKK